MLGTGLALALGIAPAAGWAQAQTESAAGRRPVGQARPLVAPPGATASGSHESVGRFVPVVTLERGTGPQQVMWLDEKGAVLDGPFQGPMAAAVDRKGNVWLGDTLNGRIVAFDAQGKQRRELDIVALARRAGLASAPLLVDLAPGASGTLLVGDAANNAVLEFGLDGRKPRVFSARRGEREQWAQINRVHGDATGRIYIEDMARQDTTVLDSTGRAVAVLARTVGVAVSPQGRVFAFGPCTGAEPTRPLVVMSATDRTPKPFALLRAPAPITWAMPLGVDAQSRLQVTCDTATQRFYVTFDAAGHEIARRAVPRDDPGFDPNRPDWVGSDGHIFSLRIAGGRCEILRLE